MSMPRAYPMELRERVVDAYDEGEGSYRELGERFRLGEATVNRWVNERRRTGSVAPKPAGGARVPRLIDKVGEEMLRTMLEGTPDLTLPELCETYASECGVLVSRQTMGETLARMGYTKKKRSSARKPRSGQMSSALERPSWSSKPR